MKKLLLSILVATFTMTAVAEGYQINNFSARRTGMANTGVAMKLNSESLYFNPAAAVFQEQLTSISGGFAGIKSSAKAKNLATSTIENSDNALSTPLHVYLNFKPCNFMSAGVAFYTPDGSAMNWGDNWSGAHMIQSINLKAFTVQPTVSFKILDNLSIGAGLMISWGNFELSKAVIPTTMNSMIAGALQQAAALDPVYGQYAQVINNSGALLSGEFSGDSKVALGVNVGILWDINEQWSIGMNYRSQMNMKVEEGEAEFDYYSDQVQQILQAVAQTNQSIATAVGTAALLDEAQLTAELPLPQTITWGVSYRPTTKWTVNADVQWIGWKAYDELNIKFPVQGVEQKSEKSYSNTICARVGAEYQALDWLHARAGIYFDQTPVKSKLINPETPSMNRMGYTCGLSLKPADFMAIDLAYAFVNPACCSRTGSYPDAYSTGGAFERNYKLKAHIFSVGLRFDF